MKTVADYLKNAPKGTKLYSPIFGECTYKEIVDKDELIYVDVNGDSYYFSPLGQYLTPGSNFRNGECLLFPSKEVRDWNNYQLPSCDFKPFDKVVVKDDECVWHIDFFEIYLSSEEFPYVCINHTWQHCLPFNEETAKLIGTKDDYIKEGYECAR